MRPLPNRVHPKCQDHGCRSYTHLVCPAECELLHSPDPDEEGGNALVIPLSVRKAAPLISIT